MIKQKNLTTSSSGVEQTGLSELLNEGTIMAEQRNLNTSSGQTGQGAEVLSEILTPLAISQRFLRMEESMLEMGKNLLLLYQMVLPLTRKVDTLPTQPIHNPQQGSNAAVPTYNERQQLHNPRRQLERARNLQSPPNQPIPNSYREEEQHFHQDPLQELTRCLQELRRTPTFKQSNWKPVKPSDATSEGNSGLRKYTERNSHWRMQTFVGHPQSVKNGSASGPTYSGKFDDNNISISPAMLASSQNPLDSHSGRDILQDADITNKVPLPMSLEGNIPASIRSDSVLDQSLHIPISDAQTTECPIINNASNQPEETAIEGGTISVSSVYSEGFMNSLAQALQSTGLDLSQASISVQIDLGKRANKGMPFGTPIFKETGNRPSGQLSMANVGDLGSGDDSEQVKKRLRT